MSEAWKQEGRSAAYPLMAMVQSAGSSSSRNVFLGTRLDSAYLMDAPMSRNGGRAVACHIIVLEPLPGERRKSNLPMLCFRNWRSKWWRVQCVGGAKACKAGECRHVAHVCEHFEFRSASGAIQRMRPDGRTVR